jgi:hypothetical protein
MKIARDLIRSLKTTVNLCVCMGLLLQHRRVSCGVLRVLRVLPVGVTSHTVPSRTQLLTATSSLPVVGTMDSATLEQQPQHHYKRPYLRPANS